MVNRGWIRIRAVEQSVRLTSSSSCTTGADGSSGCKHKAHLRHVVYQFLSSGTLAYLSLFSIDSIVSRPSAVGSRNLLYHHPFSYAHPLHPPPKHRILPALSLNPRPLDSPSLHPPRRCGRTLHPPANRTLLRPLRLPNIPLLRGTLPLSPRNPSAACSYHCRDCEASLAELTCCVERRTECGRQLETGCFDYGC